MTVEKYHQENKPQNRILLAYVRDIVEFCKRSLTEKMKKKWTKPEKFGDEDDGIEIIKDALRDFIEFEVLSDDESNNIIDELCQAYEIYGPANTIFYFLERLYEDWYIDSDQSLLEKVRWILVSYYSMISWSLSESRSHMTRINRTTIKYHTLERTEEIIEFNPIEYDIVQTALFEIVTNSNMEQKAMDYFMKNYINEKETIYLILYDAFIDWQFEEDEGLFLSVHELLILHFRKKKDQERIIRISQQIESYLN